MGSHMDVIEEFYATHPVADVVYLSVVAVLLFSGVSQLFAVLGWILLFAYCYDRGRKLIEWLRSGSETAEAATQPDDGQEPLDRLRQRYATGALTDEAFEQQVERLLETESIDDERSTDRTPLTEKS